MFYLLIVLIYSSFCLTEISYSAKEISVIGKIVCNDLLCLNPVCTSNHIANDKCCTCVSLDDCMDTNPVRAQCEAGPGCTRKVCRCSSNYTWDSQSSICVGNALVQYPINTNSSTDLEPYIPCPTGEYQPEQGKNICIRCPWYCTNCTSDIQCGGCTENEGIEMVNGVCKCKLENGYFERLIGDEKVCERCHVLCQTCNGSLNSECHSCNQNIPFIGTIADGACNCKRGYYFDMAAQSCAACHVLCEVCHGPNSNECDSCNINISNVVISVNSCTCADGFFFSSEISNCESCHSLCKTCYGKENNQCFECSAIEHIAPIQGSSCSCEQNYLYDSKTATCVFCHILCKSCFGPTNKECYECSDILNNVAPIQNSSCDCMEGYFFNETSKKCEPCDPLCKACFAEKNDKCTKCTTNIENIAPINGTTCKCNEKYFYNSIIVACLPCHNFCKNCFGLYNNQCYECDPTVPNLAPIRDNTCGCSDGYYYNSTEVTCLPCHPLCRTCHGPSNEECDACSSKIAHVVQVKNNTCDCMKEYYYYFLDTVCIPCYEFCTTCKGNSTNCQSCIKVPGVSLVGNACVCNKIGYALYHNTTINKDECIVCHPLCSSCFGMSQNECYACHSNKRAIYIEPEKCSCPNHYYYESSTEDCRQCSSECKECFGPSAKECINCLNSYSVDDTPNQCVYDCDSLSGYYGDQDTCRHCNEDCMSCSGPDNNQCTSCKSPNKVLLNSKCESGCPDGYFNQEQKCYKCHKTCITCNSNGISGCLTCASKLILWNGKCIDRCPDGTYLSPDLNACLQCQLPCHGCLSKDLCTKCAEGFYWDDNKCVEICPLGKYADEDTKTCELCSSSCEYCIGPSSSQCTSCDLKKGYYLESGKCVKMSCASGTYLETLEDEVRCIPCNRVCLACMGEGPNNCSECKKGYMTVVDSETKTIRCKKCPKGTELQSNGKCNEICGDGLNLGQFECDDGNLINGDGCSSSCTIEDGFVCDKQVEKPDICRDIRPPLASLNIMRGNVLEIVFSEKIYSSVSSKEFSHYLEVKLKDNSGLDMDFQWSLNSTFSAHRPFTKLIIVTEMNNTITGINEKFHITFKNSTLIFDKGQNSLLTKELNTFALRKLYIADTMGYVGSGFSMASWIIFVIEMGLNPFKSSKSFWVFVNMLQIICYLPIINCSVPENLRYIIINYFGISKASIPFESLPSWIPNPLTYFELFKTPPVNDRFYESGYKSVNLVYNFFNTFTTWITVLLTYLAFTIGSNVLPKIKYFPLYQVNNRPIKEMKKGYEYNKTLRILIECFLNMTFCCLINLRFVFIKV